MDPRRPAASQLAEAAERALGAAEKELKAKQRKLEKLVAKHRNALTRSSWFKGVCSETFSKVDINKNARVDITEAYVAVLLFYSKMSMVVKGLTPPTIGDLRHLVEKVSEDEQIDEVEFETLLVLLFEHLVGRVLLQCGMAFVLLPILATYLWDLYAHFYLRNSNSWIVVVVPRPIGVNLVNTLLIVAVVPVVLARYEARRAAMKHVALSSSS